MESTHFHASSTSSRRTNSALDATHGFQQQTFIGIGPMRLVEGFGVAQIQFSDLQVMFMIEARHLFSTGYLPLRPAAGEWSSLFCGSSCQSL